MALARFFNANATEHDAETQLASIALHAADRIDPLRVPSVVPDQPPEPAWRPHSLGGGYIPHISELLRFADGWWLVTAVDAEGFNYKPQPTCSTCGQAVDDGTYHGGAVTTDPETTEER